MIIGHERTETILNYAWRARCQMEKVLDALEAIGLEVDGCASSNRMGQIYGAMSSVHNAILAAFGLPEKTDVFDEAFDLMERQMPDVEIPDKFPAGLALEISRIADRTGAAEDEQQKSFEVTVAMCGGITVAAGSAEEAIAKVKAMDTDSILASGAWESPEPTDAYESD